MKLGILTYHRVVNDGSLLQAYCGQKTLSAQFPEAQVEIVDYCPAKLWRVEHRGVISRRPPFFRPWALRRVRNVKRFVKNHLVLSPEFCCTDDLQKAIQFIAEQNYDAIFVGSDTVWEARFSNYVPYAPNAYYLPRLKSAKKISYAASSDPIHSEFMSDNVRMKAVAGCLHDFDYITVRDKPTESYLTQLGVSQQDIHYLPDPTLQCDFSELVRIPEVKKQKPWAGVGYGGAVKSAAISQLKQHGFDIVDLANKTLNNKPIPEARDSVGVRLGIYSMLDFLITDRFHSSIFTLKLSGAPVLFVESAVKWPEPNSKGRDLFQRLGIDSMVWRYEGQKISPHLIADYLNTWDGLKKRLKSRLDLLQHDAAKQTKKIRNFLV